MLTPSREIIDESDVYIDVHKAIRRINPSPLARRSISTHYRHTDAAIAATSLTALAAIGNDHIAETDEAKPIPEELLLHDETHPSTRTTTPDGSIPPPIPRRSSQQASLAGIPEDILPQLKFLGPANHAGNPRQTTSKTVKIKHAGEVVHAHAESGNSNGNGNGNSMDGSLDHLTQLSVARTPDPSVLLGKKRIARSGSLIERVEHVIGGVPKTVIETTSSSDEEADVKGRGRKRGGGRGGGNSENSPLLG